MKDAQTAKPKSFQDALSAEETALRLKEEKRIRESKLEALAHPQHNKEPLNQDG